MWMVVFLELRMLAMVVVVVHSRVAFSSLASHTVTNDVLDKWFSFGNPVLRLQISLTPLQKTLMGTSYNWSGEPMPSEQCNGVLYGVWYVGIGNSTSLPPCAHWVSKQTYLSFQGLKGFIVSKGDLRFLNPECFCLRRHHGSNLCGRWSFPTNFKTSAVAAIRWNCTAILLCIHDLRESHVRSPHTACCFFKVISGRHSWGICDVIFSSGSWCSNYSGSLSHKSFLHNSDGDIPLEGRSAGSLSPGQCFHCLAVMSFLISVALFCTNYMHTLSFFDNPVMCHLWIKVTYRRFKICQGPQCFEHRHDQPGKQQGRKQL